MDVEYLLEEHAKVVDMGKQFWLLCTEPSLADRSTPSEEYPFLWFVFLEQSLVMFVFTWVYRKCIVSPIAWLLLKAAAGGRRKVKPIHVVKFEQAHIEAIQYTVFAYFGTKILLLQPWVWPSVQWWTSENKVLSKGEAFFYTAYAARYFQSYITLLLEPKRKDFVQMQIHHIVTVCLVSFSFVSGYVKVGLVVMCLMDYADPPLQWGKQIVYIRDMRGNSSGIFSFKFLADVHFAAFAVTFLVTRDVMYAYVCYASWADDQLEDNAAAICQGMLIILLGLQFFWTSLLLPVIWKVRRFYMFMFLVNLSLTATACFVGAQRRRCGRYALRHVGI